MQINVTIPALGYAERIRRSEPQGCTHDGPCCRTFYSYFVFPDPGCGVTGTVASTMAACGRFDERECLNLGICERERETVAVGLQRIDIELLGLMRGHAGLAR
jgi:hypothetical protein